ncbi:transmembrane protein, putative [Medicago truncatula]|uniref:Transmembrane protein, putative n=1 Tax=Medicago truncatula TaxID=3880 RepID=A0A072TP61_MEDTR|nr:transmembrane protein, putative [Medicago truncatula]
MTPLVTLNCIIFSTYYLCRCVIVRVLHNSLRTSSYNDQSKEPSQKLKANMNYDKAGGDVGPSSVADDINVGPQLQPKFSCCRPCISL